MTTLRQAPPDRPPERPAQLVYWRRRFVALMIGLVALALVSWAFAGAMGGSPKASPGATTTPSGAAAGLSAPAGAPSAQPVFGGASAPAQGGNRSQVRYCSSGNVVLSLFSGQASYTARQTPQFQVDVVSTDSKPCQFDIGAKHVLLQITSGSMTVWSSADCAEGQASLPITLHRGVPTEVPVTWNGQHSSAGCPVPGAPAAAGNYTATAIDGSIRSNALPFRIG